MQDRAMVFVDGSNLLATVARVIDVEYNVNKPPIEAYQLCAMIVNVMCKRISDDAKFHEFKRIRTYWFGSCRGSEDDINQIKSDIRHLDMEPMIFKQHHHKEKRVDIAIAREMLLHAFNRNYDLGILVAGDEDYLDLVNDLKRIGTRIIGGFFRESLSPSLELTFDNFHELHIWGTNHKELVRALGGTLPPRS